MKTDEDEFEDETANITYDEKNPLNFEYKSDWHQSFSFSTDPYEIYQRFKNIYTFLYDPESIRLRKETEDLPDPTVEQETLNLVMLLMLDENPDDFARKALAHFRNKLPQRITEALMSLFFEATEIAAKEVVEQKGGQYSPSPISQWLERPRYIKEYKKLLGISRGRKSGSVWFKNSGDFLIALRESLHGFQEQPTQLEILKKLDAHKLCQKPGKDRGQSQTVQLRNWIDKAELRSAEETHEEALKRYWQQVREEK